MANKNEVTLTFAGDEKKLKKTTREVGQDLDKLNRRVGQSSAQMAGNFEKSESRIGRAGRRVGTALASVGKAAAVGAAVAGVAMAKVGFDAVNMASDLDETRSKVGEIFGDQAKAIAKFAEDANTALGQTRQQAMDAAATFGVFGKAAGLTGRDLTNFSTEMVSLSADLASFANTTPEESIEAIGAALRGESEPIRKYGVLLDDATLRQRALKLGLVETTKEALTPANKALAAQAEILAQTGDAQGDFARTSDGAANQQRILRARLSEMQTELGTKLLPAWTGFIGFLNDKGIPALEATGRFVGDEIIPPLRDFGSWVRDTGIPAAQNFFDRIGDLASKIGSATEGTFGGLARFLRDDLGPIFRDITQTFLPQLRSAFEDLKEGVGDLGVQFDDIKPVLKVVGGVLLVAVAVQAGVVIAVVGQLVATIRGASFVFKTVFVPALNLALEANRKLQDGIGSLASAAINRIRTMAQKIKGFTRGLWSGIRSGLAGAINWVVDRINTLIDRINAIPGVSLSRIPRVQAPSTRSTGGNRGLQVRHQGGVVPGSPGTEVPILAMAGERVTPAGRFPEGDQRGQAPEPHFTVKVFIGDRELRDMVNVEITDHDRELKRRALAGRRDR